MFKIGLMMVGAIILARITRTTLYTCINMYDGCSLITRRCHRADPSPFASRRRPCRVRRENSRGTGRKSDDGSRGSGFAMNSIGVVARNVEELVSVTIEPSRGLNFPPLANVLLLWRRIQPFATIRMKFYYISPNWSQWGHF